MNAFVLPGEEAGAAKICYDHGQQVLMERKEHREGEVTSWKRQIVQWGNGGRGGFAYQRRHLSVGVTVIIGK